MVYFDQHQQSGDSFIGGTCTSMVLLKCDYNCLLYCNILSPTQNNQNRVDPCSCFLKSGGCDPNWASEQVTAESSGLPFLPAKQPTALFFSLFGDNSQEFVLRGLSLFEAQRGLFSYTHISHIIVCQELVIHPTCFWKWVTYRKSIKELAKPRTVLTSNMPDTWYLVHDESSSLGPYRLQHGFPPPHMWPAGKILTCEDKKCKIAAQQFCPDHMNYELHCAKTYLGHH